MDDSVESTTLYVQLRTKYDVTKNNNEPKRQHFIHTDDRSVPYIRAARDKGR